MVFKTLMHLLPIVTHILAFRNFVAILVHLLCCNTLIRRIIILKNKNWGKIIKKANNSVISVRKVFAGWKEAIWQVVNDERVPNSQRGKKCHKTTCKYELSKWANILAWWKRQCGVRSLSIKYCCRLGDDV